MRGRVRAHIFLCMLANYLIGHMRMALAPLLFDDHEKKNRMTARDAYRPWRPPGLRYSHEGHLNYFAVSGNSPSLWWFFNEVRWLWLRSLWRRSQKARLNREKFLRLTGRYFPPIKILHPLPLHRFDARTQGRSPVR
jgi:hypothetical protein